MTIAPGRAPEQEITEPDLDGVRLRPRWTWQRGVLAGIAVAGVVATSLSFRRVGLSISALVDGYDDMRRLIDRMLPIRFDNLGRTVDLVIETFFIAFVGTALAVALSIPLAFLAARNTTVNRFLFGSARGVIVLMRAIPDLVFAMIFVRAIGIGGVGGITAGILAIGLSSIGMVGKLYADAVEQIDEGPREAVLSTGGSRTQALSTGVMPQVLPTIIGVALYRFEINLRTAAVLGYVGAGGIGQLYRVYLSGLRYDLALGVTVVIIAMVILLEFVSARVRRAVLGADQFADRRLTRRLAAAGRRRRERPANLPNAPSPLPAILSTAPSPLAANLPNAPSPLAATASSSVPTAAGNGARRPAPGAQAVRPPWTRERVRMNLFVWSALATLVASFVYTGVTPLDLVASTWDIAAVSTRMVPSDVSWWNPGIRQAWLDSVAIGFAATFLGLALSVPLAFFAASNVAPARWVYALVRLVVLVIRAIPELILAVVFVAAVGMGPFPGVMALFIGTVGFATKLFADAIEEVRQGPRDAVMATGASRLQEGMTGVVPQVMPALIGTGLYILDVNIRASTVVGIVGGGGLGIPLMQAIARLDWNTVGGILVIIFVTVYSIERLAGWIRKQII